MYVSHNAMYRRCDEQGLYGRTSRLQIPGVAARCGNQTTEYVRHIVDSETK